jgi:hypothetical protein
MDSMKANVKTPEYIKFESMLRTVVSNSKKKKEPKSAKGLRLFLFGPRAFL